MEYVVRDRSVLLPLYKRFVVDPLLPAIPGSVHPNLITHVGHVVNALGVAVLVALPTRPAWTYLVAMAAVQLYVFCDNADGGHARRTRQCSPGGELLDHGLDLLNVTYIAIIAALAIGASAPWTAAIAIVLPAACALTYWEQSETGLFSLGALNQVESAMLLSAVLVGTAVFGVEVWARLAIGPLSARTVVSTFVVGVALVGVVRNFARVLHHRGGRALASGLTLLAFVTTLLVGVLGGALPAPAAIVAAAAASIFFGVRSLALRAGGLRSTPEPGLVVAVVVAIAIVLLRPGNVTVATLAAVAFFGAYGLANARAAWVHVSRTRKA